MKNRRVSNTISPWQSSTTQLKHEEQHYDQIYDVIIIGGGITGITTGLLLQKRGKKCLIIEGHNLGYGTTGGTTAHLNTFFDSNYSQIEKDFGKESATLVALAGIQAIETITSLTYEYQIDCQLETKTGYLFAQNQLFR